MPPTGCFLHIVLNHFKVSSNLQAYKQMIFKTIYEMIFATSLKKLLSGVVTLHSACSFGRIKTENGKLCPRHFCH